MDLIIGGCYQGKLDYALKKYGTAKSRWIDGSTAAWEQCFHAEGIYHFHNLIRNDMKKETLLEERLTELLEKNPSVCIICDEVGCGIVPMQKEERDFREAVGRSLCFLAKRADRVERIVCGIPQKIK